MVAAPSGRGAKTPSTNSATSGSAYSVLAAVVADAAQRDADDAVVALPRALHAGHQVEDVQQALDVSVVQRRRADRGHRDRGLLQRGRALGRGHHDLRQRLVVAAVGRGRRGAGGVSLRGGRGSIARRCRLSVRGAGQQGEHGDLDGRGQAKARPAGKAVSHVVS